MLMKNWNNPPALLLTALLAGCANQQPVDEYISLHRDVAQLDSSQWQQRYEQAAQRQQTTPTLEGDIRLALILSAVRESPPQLQQARTLIDKLLAQPERLSSSQRNFLALTLEQVEQQLQLGQLQQQLTQLRDEKALLEKDLQQLRGQLTEAQTKLEALTDIEQSIERPQHGSKP